MAETYVQSLERAFDILELLCKSRNGLSIGALSSQTGLHKSTVHRLLATMCNRGYVQKDTDTSIYHAGMHICELGGYITDNMDVIDRARAPMERLVKQTGETVHLVMRDENDIVYIHKVEGHTGGMRMVSRIGMRRPLYCTGVGKAMLATWSEEEVKKLWEQSDIQKLTPYTIVDENQFFREIAKIRKLGYSLDNQENELDIRCIAVAIKDYSGKANYALSISAPLSRMTDERIEQLKIPLLEERNIIASMLGG